MANEKIIKKVKNLLDLANNNPSENEAIAAALKAQELMAKYNIDSSAINGEEDSKEFFRAKYIIGAGHEMKKWKVKLSAIIARNFRVKTYLSNRDVVFYGYKKDAEIAVEVFKFLYEAGNKFSVRYYTKCKKEGKNTKGVMNAYLCGFCKGIEEALDKQCTALMIVVPKEVNESFEAMSAHWKHGTVHLKMSTDQNAYNQGRTEGKEAAMSRSIKG